MFFQQSWSNLIIFDTLKHDTSHKVFWKISYFIKDQFKIPYSMPTWNSLEQEAMLNQFEQNLHNIFLCYSAGTSTLLSEAAIGGVP